MMGWALYLMAEATKIKSKVLFMSTVIRSYPFGINPKEIDGKESGPEASNLVAGKQEK
jgi:hypothetical protein